MTTHTTTIEQEPLRSLNVSFEAELQEFDENKVYGDWRDEFAKKGCAVIKGALSPERAKYYADKQIEWLKSFGLGFDEQNPDTWTADHIPVCFKGGMYFGAATHEKAVWEARTEPTIINIFEKIWGTNELLSSFDGMNIAMPKRTDLKWAPWPHTDQKPERKGMEAIQGLLNFAPNGPKDGGLILMRGSSKLFNEFFVQKAASGDKEDITPPDLRAQDVFLFREQDVKWFEDRGFTQEKINLEPGDFVIWDSRTVHHARLPEGNQIRHVQYICMTPKRFATAKALEAKKWCFENYVGTTHWPHCNISMAKEEPPLRNGKPCRKHRTVPFEKPEVTDTVLRLAGIKDY